MKGLAFALFSFSLAMQSVHAEERTPVVHCENWENSVLTTVDVLRDIIDFGTPQVRFQDYLVGGVSLIDPGGFMPWFSRKVDHTAATRTQSIYGSDQESLAVDWHGEIRQVDPSGVFILKSQGHLTTSKDGKASILSVTCDTIIVM